MALLQANLRRQDRLGETTGVSGGGTTPLASAGDTATDGSRLRADTLPFTPTTTAREVLVLKLCTTLFTRVFKQCPKMGTKYEHACPLLDMNSVSQAGGQELFTEGSQVEH